MAITDAIVAKSKFAQSSEQVSLRRKLVIQDCKTGQVHWCDERAKCTAQRNVKCVFRGHAETAWDGSASKRFRPAFRTRSEASLRPKDRRILRRKDKENERTGAGMEEGCACAHPQATMKRNCPERVPIGHHMRGRRASVQRCCFFFSSANVTWMQDKG